MRITFDSNEGAGGTLDIQAPEGSTVGDIIRQNMVNYSDERHQVRVNRRTAEPNDLLAEMDHVSVMPKKVAGGFN